MHSHLYHSFLHELTCVINFLLFTPGFVAGFFYVHLSTSTTTSHDPARKPMTTTPLEGHPPQPRVILFPQSPISLCNTDTNHPRHPPVLASEPATVGTPRCPSHSSSLCSSSSSHLSLLRAPPPKSTNVHAAATTVPPVRATASKVAASWSGGRSWILATTEAQTQPNNKARAHDK